VDERFTGTLLDRIIIIKVRSGIKDARTIPIDFLCVFAPLRDTFLRIRAADIL
jgi:hypothetical protein